MNKKGITYFLIIVMLCLLVGIQENSVVTKGKETGFLTKKITDVEGKKINIKFKNPTKKVKWKVSNKKVVKLIRKKGKRNNIIRIKCKNKGTCRITAKCGKKKYNIKVIVKEKEADISDGDTNTNNNTDISNGVAGIEANVVNNVISKTDDLEIILKNTGTETYYVSYEPGKLERKEGSDYVELKLKDNISWPDIALILCGGQEQKISIPIDEYYEDATSGYYRYTKKIGEEEVSLEFQID